MLPADVSVKTIGLEPILLSPACGSIIIIPAGEDGVMFHICIFLNLTAEHNDVIVVAVKTIERNAMRSVIKKIADPAVVHTKRNFCLKNVFGSNDGGDGGNDTLLSCPELFLEAFDFFRFPLFMVSIL